MKTERISLLAQHQPFQASRSEVAPSTMGLVLLHEWFGLNEGMVAMGEKFAAEGFSVLVPDLYDGETATDGVRAAQLMNRMTTTRSMEIIAACVASLAARTGGKVGVTGFCLGGAMALAASTSGDGIAAVAPFYGLPQRSYLDASKVTCPIQAHFAAQDDWRADVIEAFAGEVKAAGKRLDLHVYEAGHAFMREGDEATYNAPAAAEAWTRVIDFLRTELA